MSFKPEDYVQISKIGSADDPHYSTPSWEEYESNKASCNSIPKDYTLEGFLMVTPEQGFPLAVKRTVRNGIEQEGFFRTSVINKILLESEFEMIFETMNSRYQMKKVLPLFKSQTGTSNWQPN